jgi:hypothetical protein
MEPVDPRVPPTLVPEGSRAEVIAEHHDVYLPLPSVTTPTGKCITRWTMTDAERAAVMRGEDIYITVVSWHNNINPMWVSVGIDPDNWK